MPKQHGHGQNKRQKQDESNDSNNDSSTGDQNALLNQTFSNTQSLIEDMKFLKEQVRLLLEENKILQEDNKKFKIEIKELREENKNLRVDLNELDQYGRRSNIRILGLGEENGENVDKIKEKVHKLFKETLGVPNCIGHIDKLHRTGKPTHNKPRPVIVRFDRHTHAENIITNRKKLKGSKIVIVEDLTPMNLKLFQKYRNSDKYESVWTRHGKTFFKEKNGNIGNASHTRYEEQESTLHAPGPYSRSLWPSSSTPRGIQQRSRSVTPGNTTSRNVWNDTRITSPTTTNRPRK